jgi:2-keto-4-pentenoate hydratase/2-oxohepta-3-ene-1,7-dioic acid hydratase in catechol pathway
MKLCQYYSSYDQREVDLSRRAPWEARVGLVVHEHIVPVTNCVEPSDTTLGLPLATRLVEWLESRSAWARLADWASRNPTGGVPLRDVYLGPPLLRPSALLDFHGFEGHAKATANIRGSALPAEWCAEPVYYNGNPTAVFGHGQRVPFPQGEEQMDFEMELACVIGRRCRSISAEQAGDVIAGYCIMNDWSARTAQAKGLRLGIGPARGKDHATSLGPYLVSRDEVQDLGDLRMRALVNGEVWCEGNGGGSRFTFEEMIAFASRCRTLFPGDIIGSGSVGSGLECGRFLKPGDQVRLEVEGLGALENTVYVE